MDREETVNLPQGPAEAAPEEKPPAPAANSVAKALRVVRAVAHPDAPHRLGDIAQRAGVPKASTHRILATLVEEGWVVWDGEGRYGIGTALRALAATVLSDDTVGIDAVLRALSGRLGQTVHLAVLSGDHATYTHKIDPGHAYRIASEVGAPLALHATAAGKVLLAHLPQGEIDALLDRAALPARTSRTLTDRAALEAELARVREAGFATEYEEADAALCSLAAPVLDDGGYPVGAVSVSSLTFLVTEEQLRAFAPAVEQTAREVSRRL
ncbi:IclR family transcriptional regulator [Streptomyces sp. NPDC059740]|uniref:IclR family transcriptional regulator n=1 Tax=Streptomyces sp. NPDC059740 TaxID=3346926 RepID=UPI00365CE806